MILKRSEHRRDVKNERSPFSDFRFVVAPAAPLSRRRTSDSKKILYMYQVRVASVSKRLDRRFKRKFLDVFLVVAKIKSLLIVFVAIIIIIL